MGFMSCFSRYSKLYKQQQNKEEIINKKGNRRFIYDRNISESESISSSGFSVLFILFFIFIYSICFSRYTFQNKRKLFQNVYFKAESVKH